MGVISSAWVSASAWVLASRMVADYVEKLYAPAALSAREVEVDSYSLARDLASYRHRVVAADRRRAPPPDPEMNVPTCQSVLTFHRFGFRTFPSMSRLSLFSTRSLSLFASWFVAFALPAADAPAA